MTLIYSFADWIHDDSNFSQIPLHVGIATDFQDNLNSRMVSVIGVGGRQPGPDSDYSLIRIIILGPQNSDNITGELRNVGDLALYLQNQIRIQKKTCEAWMVPRSSIIGPLFTAEKRVYYEQTVELMR